MLKNKLLLLFIIIGFCILVIVGSIFGYILRNDKFLTVKQDYQNQLEYVDFAIVNFFNEIKSDVEELSIMEAVRVRQEEEFTNFLNADTETFQYNIGETEQTIIDIFNNYRITHPYISSVYMGRENGSFVRSHKRAEPTQYDPRTRPWYTSAKESPNEVIMTDPYIAVTTPDINIGVEKALVDENNEVFGVVGIDVTLKNLTDYIKSIKVGKNGWAMMVNSDGTILVSDDIENQLKNIVTFDEKNLKVLLEETKGYTIFNKDSRKYYLFFDTSPELEWKIGFVIPFEEIDREVWISVSKVLLAVLFTLILFSVVTLIGLQKFVLKPLKKLDDFTSVVTETGRLDHYVEIDSKDEIGHLGKSFNKMMDSINKSDVALKASEKALRKLNDELEKKVTERTNKLTEANIRLKELDRLKSLFISSMSHELRTPLNSIIGFTSIILSGMAGKITSEQKKQLGMVKGSADYLLELVTDVIDVSKIESGKVDLYIEDFDLPDLIEEIRKSHMITIKKKNLNFNIEMPDKLSINSDRRRVKQIIINFLTNAFKYTEKGKVELKVYNDNRTVSISVKDTGIGIKEENMKNLFKQFSRIRDSGEQIVEGTGLGLYLSKKIADVLGGIIIVKSIYGKGSEFIITLPLRYTEVKNEESFNSGR